MSVSAQEVKELRDRSGVGMMDCKKALVEANGDIDKAFDILRKSGIAKAKKKSGRDAKEGLIISSISSDNKFGALLELNCETDFVANTDDFKSLGDDIVKHVLNSDFCEMDDIMNESFVLDENKKVKDIITDAVGRLGENIVLSRFCKYKIDSGFVVSYIHPGAKLGVLLEINCETDNTNDSKDLAKEVSMHIAATNPISIQREDVDESIVQKEKDIFSEQAKKSGKPENIIEKMVEGRLNKFYQESVLLEQNFVKDPSKTIKELISEKAGILGENIIISNFSRYQIGEK
ncbi:MAG: elongation factor Ts [Candidatus Marinimicrobia bacterium]|nr:elongation factor Ts [Candidatus Neomarinimicrobiota bacterium]|tara:strand:+ start:4499 stop:5368 length:870 start_codon:yes stop_codon:yes gene_type:complete